MKTGCLLLVLSLAVPATAFAQFNCDEHMKKFDEGITKTLKASADDVALAKSLRAEAGEKKAQGDEAGCIDKMAQALEMAEIQEGG